LRHSVAAVALIRRKGRGPRALWLAQWNSRWECFNFVAGHKRPDESFRECVIREIEEELNLREGIDFVVKDEPLAHVEFEAWSESAQANTHYVMELFDVTLTGESVVGKIDARRENCWLTRSEIRRGRSADGRPVGATMKRLLTVLTELH
jgi:8-oxo-dGTP pyrophosphatase MutT (NUDIX family)